MPSIRIESTNSMIIVLGKNNGQASLDSTCAAIWPCMLAYLLNFQISLMFPKSLTRWLSRIGNTPTRVSMGTI